MLSTGLGSESEIKRGREEGREERKEGGRKKIWSDVLMDLKNGFLQEKTYFYHGVQGEGRKSRCYRFFLKTNKQKRQFIII